MNRGVLVTLIIVICTSAALSGCQDTNSVKTQNLSQNVHLDSTIVEFANVSLVKNINRSKIVESVTVAWLLHNIAGRIISAKINAQFYDKNNNFLYNDTRQILYMPAGYIEHYLSPSANKITYEGPGAALVDHVLISVTEI